MKLCTTFYAFSENLESNEYACPGVSKIREMLLEKCLKSFVCNFFDKIYSKNKNLIDFYTKRYF